MEELPMPAQDPGHDEPQDDRLKMPSLPALSDPGHTPETPAVDSETPAIEPAPLPAPAPLPSLQPELSARGNEEDFDDDFELIIEDADVVLPETPADALPLTKKPNLVSPTDELAEAASTPSAEDLDASTIDFDASHIELQPLDPSEAEGSAPSPGAPERDMVLDDPLAELAGVGESENVVGGGDLLDQLDQLDNFAPEDGEELDDGTTTIYPSVGHGNSDSDEEDWTAGLEDTEVASVVSGDRAAPARRSSGSSRYALAALLLIAGTAGVYFGFLRKEPTVPESIPVAVIDVDTGETDVEPETETKPRQLDLVGADEDSREDPTETFKSAAGTSNLSPRETQTDLLADASGDGSEDTAVDVGAALSGDAAEGTDTSRDPNRPLIAASARPSGARDAASKAEIEKLERQPLGPDEIILSLKNGNTFQGRLKRVTETELVLSVYNGEITFETESLAGILPRESSEYQPPNSFPDGFVEFNHGNRIYGKIVDVTPTRVIMEFSGARLVFSRQAVEVDFQHPIYVRSDLH